MIRTEGMLTYILVLVLAAREGHDEGAVRDCDHIASNSSEPKEMPRDACA